MRFPPRPGVASEPAGMPILSWVVVSMVDPLRGAGLHALHVLERPVGPDAAVVAGLVRQAVGALRVAGALALRRDEVDERVLLAVDPDLLDLEHVAGGEPLLPELVPAPAPVGREPAAARLVERLAVHEREDEDVLRARVLRDDGEQRAAVRPEVEEQLLRVFLGHGSVLIGDRRRPGPEGTGWLAGDGPAY